MRHATANLYHEDYHGDKTDPIVAVYIYDFYAFSEATMLRHFKNLVEPTCYYLRSMYILPLLLLLLILSSTAEHVFFFVPGNEESKAIPDIGYSATFIYKHFLELL